MKEQAPDEAVQRRHAPEGPQHNDAPRAVPGFSGSAGWDRGARSSMAAYLAGTAGNRAVQRALDDTAPIPLSGGAGKNRLVFTPTSNSTYAVSGGFASMATGLAAKDEAGQWTPSGSPGCDTDPDGNVSAVTGTLADAISLPKWDDADYQKATTAEQGEWNRFLGALTAHEAKHHKIWADGMNGLTSTVGQSTDKFDAAVAAVDTAEAKYDTDTQHGQTEGTKININLGQTIKVP